MVKKRGVWARDVRRMYACVVCDFQKGRRRTINRRPARMRCKSISTDRRTDRMQRGSRDAGCVWRDSKRELKAIEGRMDGRDGNEGDGGENTCAAGRVWMQISVNGRQAGRDSLWTAAIPKTVTGSRLVHLAKARHDEAPAATTTTLRRRDGRDARQ